MQIILNGKPHALAEASSVAQLLESLGLAGELVAVERNLEIVPKAERAAARLEEGDQVEVLRFMGGGR
jgi:thiamine biosynthesis protein ThiS